MNKKTKLGLLGLVAIFAFFVIFRVFFQKGSKLLEDLYLFFTGSFPDVFQLFFIQLYIHPWLNAFTT